MKVLLTGYSNIKSSTRTPIPLPVVSPSVRISDLGLVVWSTARNAVRITIASLTFLILPLLSSSFGQNMFSYRSSLRIAGADVAGQTAVTPLTLQMPAQQSTLILTVMSLAAAIQIIFAVAEIEYHTILGPAHPSKSGPALQAAALANIST